jgi:Xaa-Pro aminopeptidase
METEPFYNQQFPVHSFTLRERDRRWGIVRSLMDAAGIDILIAPNPADSRYLSQMADDIGPTIVPISGDVTALSSRGRTGGAAVEWVPDIRQWSRRWIEGLIDRLQELDADRKIIGISGLDGFMRRPDGDLNYQTLIVLREVFSHARWVGATQLMQEARFVKSDEEIEALTRGAAVADAGLNAAVDHFRIGVSDRELWGQMALGMMRAGGDSPRFAHLGLAPLRDIGGLSVHPAGRTADREQLLYAEVEGLFAGYAAQGVQPAAIGPVPKDWLDAWDVCREAWDRTWELLRPGATFGEISAAAEAASKGPFRARPTLHGQGLGDDMPLITPGASVANRVPDRRLEPGVCFVLKPYAEWTDGGGPKGLNWGDTVVITETGARRLGSRPHELVIRE